MPLDRAKDKAKATSYDSQDSLNAIMGSETATGTSIFDPVLCEIAYRWFSPVGGLILDPFAGGSVRGIVASKLGRQYIGHELRQEQVDANRAQGSELCGDEEHPPAWICGDSRNIDTTCADVQAMYDRFGAITVVAETNSIDLPAIQRLRTLGVNVTPFTTTNATKDYAIQNLVMAFEKAEIKILRDEVLINELQRYQMHKLPSGARGYSAPVGTHDDCVMSLAMAYSRAGKQRKEAKSY
jgi:hypothetical protein